MSRAEVMIIGAGIGGLSLALGCINAGIKVRVFEKAPELGEIGAGIMLTPNAVKCYDFLGLGDALSRVGVEPEESVYRRFDTAEEMVRAPLKARMQATYGAKYFHIHRADLHACLLQAVSLQDPDAVKTGYSVAAVKQSGDRVTAKFENGQAIESDALVACDGIHSSVRAQLFGDVKPRFTGQMAWRGMVPAEGLPATVTEPVSVSWLGEHKHVIQYGVRDRRFINYVAIVATNEWIEEGWNRRADPREAVKDFEGWHSDLITLLRATPDDGCYKWGLFDRDPLESWTLGRITLLGDAAHPMLPFMAQGSAMAVEDAVVLARALSSCATVGEAFQRYEQVRRPRANDIVLKSRQATNLYQRLTGDKSSQRASNLDAVYGHDARTVEL
jgi:salicylate hydroxylase